MTPTRWAALALAIVGAVGITIGLYFFIQDVAEAAPHLSENPGASVADLFAEHPELEEAWWFDNESKGWQVHIRAIEPKNLLYLHPGEPYVIIVSSDVTVQGHQLTCQQGICLNLITWR